MTAYQLAKEFAKDVEARSGFKPLVMNKGQSREYGAHAEALVILEGVGDLMIELTLTGKYATRDFYAEPYTSYQVGIFKS